MSGPLEVVVFTDGAAKGNPGPGGWGAVIRIARAAVRELGGFGGHTTNNRMEMTAALQALNWLGSGAGGEALDVAILTDSTYLIRGVTQWMASWKRRGWKTADGSDVANRDLWEALAQALGHTALAGPKVQWRYVRGHVGIAGNERADAIASGFAAGTAVVLYEGPCASYVIDLDATTGEEPVTSSSRRKSSERSGAASKKAAYSYLSVVDGVPARHRDWAACERRVKGRSAARFKKARDSADEEAILADWGFALEDVAGS